MSLTIGVIGLGYVGIVTSACLARLGHTVIGVDSDPQKVGDVLAGHSPVSEPDVDELLREGLTAARISVASLAEAVVAADVVMVCVGTPSTHSGALDLSAVLRVCEQIGRALPADGRFRTVVIRSTVLPGTTLGVVAEALESASGLRLGVDFALATNPEFLREGSGVQDFYGASRTIIGADDERAAQALTRIYDDLEAQVVIVPVATSELIKYADNAFHAVKIAFANEIGTFSRAFAIDGRDVLRVLVADDRLNISPAYLRPGFSFGGSCLPKDLRAMTERAHQSSIELPLLDAALSANSAHFERGVRMVEAAGNQRVSMLGLSFKRATDDLRESPAVALAERLIGSGHEVAIYDPDVLPGTLRGANRSFIDEHLPHLRDLLTESLDLAIDRGQTIVVTKDWPALIRLPELLTAAHTVVDLVGLPSPVVSGAWKYAGICW